jgi:hypothetical protein
VPAHLRISTGIGRRSSVQLDGSCRGHTRGRCRSHHHEPQRSRGRHHRFTGASSPAAVRVAPVYRTSCGRPPPPCAEALDRGWRLSIHRGRPRRRGLRNLPQVPKAREGNTGFRQHAGNSRRRSPVFTTACAQPRLPRDSYYVARSLNRRHQRRS